MIVSIMQPAYLPWLGYFHRIEMSDIHIVLDHVQIDRNSKTNFVNRNKVRTKQGWCWLTVPIKTKGKFGQLEINKLEVSDDKDWMDKHWATLMRNYSKALYFEEHKEFFEDCYSSPKSLVVHMNKGITNYLLRQLDIKTEMIRSSEMNPTKRKDDLILELCRKAGATIYVSGPFGRDYLQEEKFRENGIKIIYHEYIHPTYPQTYPGFEPYMSVIDLMFNCGPESLSILKHKQKQLSL
jgi:hypothetical protein